MKHEVISPKMNYESLRRINIERNRQFLSDIGLNPGSEISNGEKLRKISSKRKRCGKETGESIPERRSLRIADLPPPSYKDYVAIYGSGKTGPISNIHVGIDDEETWPEAVTSTRKKLAQYDPLSSKSIVAQIDVFLENPHIPLGEPIEETGKAAVMALANGGRPPKFSKYSGVVQWTNGFFLWVNMVPSPTGIGGSGGYYPNMFLEDGRYMTWFGGSLMRPDSEGVLSLLYAARDPSVEAQLLSGESEEAVARDTVECMKTSGSNSTAANDREKAADVVAPTADGQQAVLLFVRMEGCPYACLGRVAVSELNLTAKPIRITWKLLDFDVLNRSDNFRYLLGINSPK